MLVYFLQSIAVRSCWKPLPASLSVCIYCINKPCNSRHLLDTMLIFIRKYAIDWYASKFADSREVNSIALELVSELFNYHFKNPTTTKRSECNFHFHRTILKIEDEVDKALLRQDCEEVLYTVTRSWKIL